MSPVATMKWQRTSVGSNKSEARNLRTPSFTWEKKTIIKYNQIISLRQTLLKKENGVWKIAPKTSDKWLDSPFSLPGFREKFGISSGVIWGIVLSTQKGIQIFCTLQKYKKSIPSPFKKRSTPKRCYVTGSTIKFGIFFTIQGNSKFVDKFQSTYTMSNAYYHLFQCVRLHWRVCSDTFYRCCTQPWRSYRLRSHSWRLLCFCCCVCSWG